ncbi:FliA/WhiG family RNA polymerase sigma factor [Pragia fontium]|uniref:RNA polymerase sigma factor for flagellar operon FliA n=2 Tax=Pragia fontium TaxID=82985 RepID=A0AAJ4W7N6_9GAMM|nr:FliA/WhiG family RNA polymerase sigma factor [Pragia fontium]AKJ43755.1 flagellar biosynthesis sigma factor [Pragia fontium]SFC00631.1 RNA polymerase sigma factor for flagellar operon FliA [Pragia fontium DSM 5563 = ATCC 49100]SUB81657.1 Sigma-F factor [Pragia fontium]VEJ54151.1 Sigma-F factor [Pragia fontium]
MHTTTHGIAEFQDVALMSAQEEEAHLKSYLPLVKRTVNQLAFQASSVMDRQDMEQIALMGLLDCLRRYGPPDEQFAAYAIHRVRGAILDELRQLDWRPRRLRQKTHKLNDAIRELTKKLGKEPNFDEISQALGISAEEYQEYLLLDSARAMESLDELLMPESQTDVLQSRSIEDEEIARRMLATAIKSLDEREKVILSLYYQEEMSLKEIALVMDLTEARICQMNKKISEKIKCFF